MLMEFLKEKMESTFRAVNATKINFDLMVENLLYYNDFENVKYTIEVSGDTARVSFKDYSILMTMIVEKDEYDVLEYSIAEVMEIE